MVTHAFGIVAVIAGIMLCTVLPFLPGRYDTLAVPLSDMAQIFGKGGLLLVPVGALWMAAEFGGRLAGTRYRFAVATLIVSALVWALVSLIALIHSVILGIAAIAVFACAMSKVIPALRRLTTAGPGRPGLVALYLIVGPVVVLILQMALANRVTEFGRGRAIRNSAPLIAEIERYHAQHGRYPASLLALWIDHSPSVIGVSEYRYEPSGDAYNLAFEACTFILGTREIVMYNPRDEQVATSHATDLLRWTAGELELRRGYYAVHDAPQPHWKYYWFD
jgi:hypothetical protein